MNKHDVKKRDEVGYQDMEKYEHGGLEIEETLTNGYLLYVPYGIHCDVFDALEQGIVSMNKQVADLQKTYQEFSNLPVVQSNILNQIESIKKHIDVLQKISSIKYEV